MHPVPFQTLSGRPAKTPLSRAAYGITIGFILASLIPISAVAAGASKPTPKPVSAPADPLSKHPKVDSGTVHRLYLDGDFEEAIQILETNLKDSRQYRHNDSVFIFKHLGVMYAAQYDTREKGKYYMHRLLQVEPTANILDMYASDMIYMIFKNIKGEYEQNQMMFADQLQSKGEAGAGQGSGGQTAGAGASKEPGKESGSKTWIWAGTAVVAVAAGLGAYMLLAGPGTVQKNSEF